MQKNYRYALFLLLLLTTHEAITVARNIKASRRSKGLHRTLTKFKATEFNFLDTEGLGVLLEAGASSPTLKQRTEEIRSIHGAIRDSFSFKGSPVLEDVQKLQRVPSGPEPLSAEDLGKHELDVSLFLEKSLSHINAALSNQKLLLRKNSDDFDAAVKSMGDSHISLNVTILKHIDAIMFGFWDGFFSGLITDFNEANKSPTCTKGRKVVANRMKVLARNFQDFWAALRKVKL